MLCGPFTRQEAFCGRLNTGLVCFTLLRMIRVPALLLGAATVLLMVFLTGCVPAEDDHVDETRDPNYQRGCALIKSQDFDGAIGEFEKALEVNPHSSEAHFQLAWLCEEKQKNYAAAIYHYQKHLAFRPNSEYAVKAKEHIEVCILELAKAKFSPPSTMALQREIDRQTAENQLLKQQVESLRTQLAASLAAALNRPAPPPAAAPGPAQTASPPTAPAVAVNPAPAPQNSSGSPRATPAAGMDPAPPVAPLTAVRDASPLKGHTHTVKSGDTLASIAGYYHVKLAALMQANPDVNPKRLKVGQTLNLP